MGKFELAKLLIGAWTFRKIRVQIHELLNEHYKELQTV